MALVDNLPLISVVVPSYNQGHFLPDTFASIFRQQYPRLEVIVIDGGSTDGSVDVIRRHESRLKFWRSERDGGQSAAINEGMRHCAGDLVAWLNSDDYYWDDCLWTVGKAYAQYPGSGLYVGNGLRFDQRARTYVPFNPRHVAMDREALTWGPDFVLQPSTFFLREAWQQVGGLDNQLRFCMDWDIFIRIANQYPCVVINEFLGVSREYEETKTRSGKMERAFEIVRMIRAHTHQEATRGSLLYLLETLPQLDGCGMTKALIEQLHKCNNMLGRQVNELYGHGTCFPEQTDALDEIYLPFARSGSAPLQPAEGPALPFVSVVVAPGGHADYLDDTCAALSQQAYTGLEIRVEAGEPIPAIDRGLATTSGEVLGWYHAGDLPTDGALHAVGAAFAADPDLDLVYGNAVHLDEAGQLALADHGQYFSGFWYGELPATEPTLKFRGDSYLTPQPAVFFRRRLLERCGGLNAAVRHGLPEADLFRRFAAASKVKKLERTLALARVWVADYGRERQRLLAAAYRFDRPRWPWLFSKRGLIQFKHFVGDYLRWKFPNRGRDPLFYAAAALIAASAATRIGNPMAWWRERTPRALPAFKKPGAAVSGVRLSA